jgi:hypothetical protein
MELLWLSESLAGKVLKFSVFAGHQSRSGPAFEMGNLQ